MKQKVTGVALAACLFLLAVPASMACLRGTGPCYGYGCPAWTAAKTNTPKTQANEAAHQKKAKDSKTEARKAEPPITNQASQGQ